MNTITYTLILESCYPNLSGGTNITMQHIDDAEFNLQVMFETPLTFVLSDCIHFCFLNL